MEALEGAKLASLCTSIPPSLCRSAKANQLQNDGGVQAIVSIVATSPTDPATIENSMMFIDNMNTLGIPIDGASLAVGMVNIFTKGGVINPKTGKRVTAALALVAKTPEGAVTLQSFEGVSLVRSKRCFICTSFPVQLALKCQISALSY